MAVLTVSKYWLIINGKWLQIHMRGGRIIEIQKAKNQIIENIKEVQNLTEPYLT